MLYKKLLALVLWCHCYQIVLNPFLQLLASSMRYCPFVFEGASGHSLFLRQSGYLVTGSPIIVGANEVALTPGHDIVLRCNVPDNPELEFTWTRIRYLPKPKPKGPEEDMRPVNDRYIINNNVLILKSPSIDDVGDYFCKANDPANELQEKSKMIIVRARPYIEDFQLESSTYRSATIEEGKPLKLVCNVIDAYSPDSNITIKWTMSRFEEDATDEVQNGEDGIKIEVYNATSQAIIIDEVTKDHRRFFKCRASNGITDNSKVILIRVKDRYNVIWPSLGIIIEFIILIVVICVVENRKVEPDKEIYDHKAAHM